MQNKTSNQASSGLLEPLPIHSPSWSHLSMDFFTRLPSSNSNTIIFTIIDQFYKFAHFVPLPKLPSALETAEILVRVVFRWHGIPLDVVSDRGPQFTSAVWRAFCTSMGISVSLSSGFHPQMNGQSERANQAVETTVRYLASSSLTSKSLEGTFSLSRVFGSTTYSATWHLLWSWFIFTCSKVPLCRMCHYEWEHEIKILQNMQKYHMLNPHVFGTSCYFLVQIDSMPCQQNIFSQKIYTVRTMNYVKATVYVDKIEKLPEVALKWTVFRSVIKRCSPY